jgi:hypothetical protein
MHLSMLCWNLLFLWVIFCYSNLYALILGMVLRYCFQYTFIVLISYCSNNVIWEVNVWFWYYKVPHNIGGYVFSKVWKIVCYYFIKNIVYEFCLYFFNSFSFAYIHNLLALSFIVVTESLYVALYFLNLDVYYCVNVLIHLPGVWALVFGLLLNPGCWQHSPMSTCMKY